MKYKKAELIAGLRRAAEGATLDTYMIIDSRRQKFEMQSGQLGINQGWLRAVWYASVEDDYACWKLNFTLSGLVELQRPLHPPPKPKLDVVLGYPVDSSIRTQLKKICLQTIPRHHKNAIRLPCNWCKLSLWVEFSQLAAFFERREALLCCPFCAVGLLKQGLNRVEIKA
jgi:hypothetical protein